MFSCEICEIFKNTFFYKTPPRTAFLLIFGGLSFIMLNKSSICVTNLEGKD